MRGSHYVLPVELFPIGIKQSMFFLRADQGIKMNPEGLLSTDEHILSVLMRHGYFRKPCKSSDQVFATWIKNVDQ